MRHTVTLPDGIQLNYSLERRQRRTVGLKITDHGLVVHAPTRVAHALLETLILQKADWILKKLQTRQENKLPPLQWQDGEQLLFLGNAISLAIKLSARSNAVHHDSGQLEVTIPAIQEEKSVARQYVAHKVVQWYKKQALTDFTRRLEIFSAKLDVPLPRLLISNARTRWGSCNSRREIRINWRLLQAPPQLINYVICHELAHLKEMNHSARFWQVVESIYPDYRAAEKALKIWSPRLHLM